MEGFPEGFPEVLRRPGILRQSIPVPEMSFFYLEYQKTIKKNKKIKKRYDSRFTTDKFKFNSNIKIGKGHTPARHNAIITKADIGSFIKNYSFNKCQYYKINTKIKK